MGGGLCVGGWVICDTSYAHRLHSLGSFRTLRWAMRGGVGHVWWGGSCVVVGHACRFSCHALLRLAVMCLAVMCLRDSSWVVLIISQEGGGPIATAIIS